MNKTWKDLDELCQGKVHIVAIVAWPRRSTNAKYINCDLQVFFKARGKLFYEWSRFSQDWGSINGCQFRIIDHVELARRKMNCEKQSDLLNLNDVRNDMKYEALRAFFHGGEETFDDNLLCRFAIRALINPWSKVDRQWGYEKHQEFDLCKLDRNAHFSWNGDGVEYGGKAEALLQKIASLPVLPFAYSTKVSHRGDKINAKARWVNLADEIADDDRWGFSGYSEVIKWAKNKHLESKGKSTWTERATVKAITKAIKKAASAGRISTANARKWFQKFNAVSLLGDWARREKKALNINNA